MVDQPDWTNNVQNIVTASKIYQGLLAVTAGTPIQIPVDMSPWGQVVVAINPPPGAPGPLFYEWLDDASTGQIDNGFVYSTLTHDSWSFTTTVKSKNLWLIFPGAGFLGNVTVGVFATSSIAAPDLAEKSYLNDFSVTQAYVSGTAVTLGTIKSLGRQMFFIGRITAAALTGLWLARYYNFASASTVIVIADNVETHADPTGTKDVNKMIILPTGYFDIQFLPLANVASTVTATLMESTT